MDIKQLCNVAQNTPEAFNVAASEYKQAAINRLCGGDKQCEWRVRVFDNKLDKEAGMYIDNKARLNFVIARFWSFINTHYAGKVK